MGKTTQPVEKQTLQQPPTKRGTPQGTMVKIKHASDFTGLGTSSIALKLLTKKCPNVTLEHIWSCDKKRVSKQFVMDTDPPAIFFDNVLCRDFGRLKSPEANFKLHGRGRAHYQRR
jgi:hypothetical protein